MTEIKRFDPDLEYIGAGSYVPSMQESASGDYVDYAQWDETRQQRDKLMAFVEEYIEAWNDGMAGDSYLLRNAQALIKELKGKS